MTDNITWEDLRRKKKLPTPDEFPFLREFEEEPFPATAKVTAPPVYRDERSFFERYPNAAVALEVGFAPFTITGMGTFETLQGGQRWSERQINLRELWAKEVEKIGRPTKENIEQLVALKEKYEPWIERYEPEAERERIEEFREMPWWQQALWEAPAWLAAPTATGIKGALAPVAARPGIKGVVAGAISETLAPVAVAEAIPGAVLKYGVILPVTKGIKATTKKAFQTALDTGLDKWIATQARVHPEYRGRFANFIVENRSWLAERATNNLLRRQAEKKGIQTAVQDTVKETERLFLKSIEKPEIPLKGKVESPSPDITRPQVQANIQKEFYEPIKESPLDLPSTTYVKSGNFDDYIKNMPQFKKLTPAEATELGVALRTTEAGKLLPAMRKSGFFVNEEFANYPDFVDVNYVSGTWQDPTRMMQNIQGGFENGAMTKYVLYPTRSTQIASMDFSDTEKFKYRAILEKYKMVGDKKTRNVAGDVIEYIGKDEARVDIRKIMAKPEVKKILSGYSMDDKRRIIRFAQESRKNFDSLIGNQNKARVKRNQTEIEYRDNYRPWVMETNVWSKLFGLRQKPDTVMKSPQMPDYIKPAAPFNARALAREGGMANYPKEKDLQKLMYDYIDTAAKDIFNTNIIHNAKIHAATLRSMGHQNSAALVEDWATEAYAGISPRVSRGIRTVVPMQAIKPALWLRRRLTSAVFPLNFSWNLFVQTSSGALTVMRYGIRNSIKGMEYLFNSDAKRDVREKAYSWIIKQRQAGKIAYQDIGSSTAKVRELEASPIEHIEHYANFLTNTLEEKLTGISVRAAYYDGIKKGLSGRELWEHASEGGAKTQSMYNLEDLPGVLRAKEVGALVPFQTFAFEVFNSVRELNIIGVRRVVGKAGAYESTSAKSAEGKATIDKRLKMLAEWIGCMVAINMYVDKVINRKPWSTSSFIPFFSVMTGGVNAGNPWNMVLPYRYTYELSEGINKLVKYGTWNKLRAWAIRYHMIGGVQLERMLKGVEALAEGEVSDVSGREMFKVKEDEWWRVLTLGVYATEGGREYMDELQEKEGGVIKEYTGISIPQRTLSDEWRDEFDEYYERDEEGKRIIGDSYAYRAKHPELDAKLFVTNKVETLQSVQAKKIVLELMKDHQISPEEISGFVNVFGRQELGRPSDTEWEKLRR